MAAKTKTTYTEVGVYDFVQSYVENDQKRMDSLELIALMKSWSGHEPKMWGPTIIGFGNYHYKYASGHEGDAPILGFSPRKAEFSLYVYMPTPLNDKLVSQLGKIKMAKACIYFKRLSDLNLDILEQICRESMRRTKEMYPD